MGNPFEKMYGIGDISHWLLRQEEYRQKERKPLKFKEFEIKKDILNAVRKAGYEEATPIQEKAIPVIMEGRDVIGLAQTGTGKTAAFALPILNNIEFRKKKRLQESLQFRPLKTLRSLVAIWIIALCVCMVEQ